MAVVDTKISDLSSLSKAANTDYILVTKEDVGNYKILQSHYSQTSAESVGAVFITGNQDIAGVKNFTEAIQVSGKNLISDSDIRDIAVLVYGDQNVSGKKTFIDEIGPSGDIVSSSENKSLVISDGRITSSYRKEKSLSLAFENGVYITGGVSAGAKLHVEGDIVAERIETLEDIIGADGATVWTDGRNPDLFEGPNKSLALAFQNGVYITGGVSEGGKLHVEGDIVAERIETLEDIVGADGATVWTDGRNPDLFEGPNKSLSLAFENGVYITGAVSSNAKLYVQGDIVAETIETLEDIVGASGSTVWTDGRNPDLFEGSDKSLTFAFESGVNVTGASSQLRVEGKINAAEISTQELEIAGEVTFSSLAHFTHHNWTDDRSTAVSNDEVYLPFPTSADQFEIEDVHYTVAPYPGRIKSITFRPSTTSAGNVTFEVRATGDGVDVLNNPGWRPHIQESVSDSSTAHTHQVFEFTNTQHFEKGQVVAISYDSATKLRGCAAVVEWRYDTST